MQTRTTPFADRDEAGRELAGRLTAFAGRADVVVLALPRGGVPVAAPVARALGAPLDVLVVRKLGLPEHPELAAGAIAGVGDAVELVRNERVLAAASLSEQELQGVYDRELDELRRRERAYRAGRPAVDVRGAVAILVDDGLATGSTMLAAVAAVRRQDPAQVVVAVPVGSKGVCRALREHVDEVVCGYLPEPFHAVGQGYRVFDQTEDEQVRAVLREAAAAQGQPR